MSDETEPKPSSAGTSDAPSSVGVPVAIVIAGALIAVAIYFGGGVQRTGGVAVDNQKGATAEAQPQERKQVAGATVGEIRSVDNTDHIRGASNPKVTIVEYSDFECPFCKRFHGTMKQLLSEYPNDVRWVYRQFPLEQLHSNAPKQAEATECAGEQGKFWELADKIFEVTPSNNGLDMASLPKLAREAGVANIAQFQSCLDNGKYAKHVQEDIDDAAVAGGRGTPYSVIIGPNGEKEPLSGAQPYAAVKAAVQKYLQ